MVKISYAPDAWKLLEGIFCVYKPTEMSMDAVKNRLLGNLCRDLNSMEVRPPENYVKIEDDPSSETGLTVRNVPNLADDPMVVGPRYQMQDFRASWATSHGAHTSGLCVFGINCGRTVRKLAEARYLKSYHICSRFGLGTDNYHISGKIVEKSTFGHIKQFRLDQVLTSIQAAHQRHMFNYMGLNIQSQEAYELASQGMVRPAEKSQPLLYGIKCIDLRLPNFTLEVQCINESEAYLMKLVHELGLTLKSNAVCTGLRQIQFGHFGLEHALLRKHWTVEHIINNIVECKKLFSPERVFPKSANLMLDSRNTEVQYLTGDTSK